MKEYWIGLSRVQKIKYILGGVVGILVVIFAVLNWRYTNVDFLLTRVRIPITLLILMSVAGGFGFASLFDYRKFKNKDKLISGLKKQLEARKEE